MINNEIRFTEKDISKFRNKIKGKFIFTFIFFILSSISIFYFFKLKGEVYIFLCFLILIFLGTLTHMIYLINKFKDDMRAKVKISKNLIVSGKKIKRDKDGGFESYVIFFSGDLIHRNYQVHKKDFNKILVGDSIHLECTKFGNWILSIKHEGKDIENQRNFL